MVMLKLAIVRFAGSYCREQQERMTIVSDYAVQLVIEELSKLGAVTSEGVIQAISYLWPLATKKALTGGIKQLVFTVVFAVIGVCCICFCKRVIQSRDNDPDLYWSLEPICFLIFGVGCVMVIFSIVALGSALDTLINLEWKAIQILLSQIEVAF